MTFSTLLMMLALATGPGTSPSTSSEIPIGNKGEPEYNCWINGVWYNPCPQGNGTPWDPEPPPPTEPPD